MSADERLLQRFHDGEASRAEAIGVERLLGERPQVRSLSTKMECLHELLRRRSERMRGGERAPQDIIAQVMERLPDAVPRRQVQLSFGQVALGIVALVFVVLASTVAESLRNLVPLSGVATVTAAFGLVMLVAARPLMRLEAGLFARLMRRRLSVGDGEVLVCRVLGIALLIVGGHLVGFWG